MASPTRTAYQESVTKGAGGAVPERELSTLLDSIPFLDDTAPEFTGTPSVPAIAASDASLGITGLAAAQGGAIVATGGASSTSANAGGAVSAVGGAPGATGVGGAVNLTGAAGGATSGAGGAVNATGGAGTAGNAAGGAVVATGGAGQGSAAGGAVTGTGGAGGATGVGGAASLVGGAGGATSGKGGAVNLTGGAGSAGNAAGGSVVLQPGAKNGSGLDGGVFIRGTTQFRKYATPGAGADQAEVLTAAQLIGGIFVHTISTGRTLTTPTGANISAGCPSDLAVGDSFLFHLITVGTGADDIVTLTAGDGNVTFVGNVTAGPDASTFNGYGTWLFRNTGTNTWVGYRVG